MKMCIKIVFYLSNNNSQIQSLFYQVYIKYNLYTKGFYYWTIDIKLV